jgi:hypothetical protein
VAENFIPVQNMENLTVNHKDGDKENNRLENLEWNTSSENNQHAWGNGLNHAHILRPVKQYNLQGEYLQTY